MNAQQATYIKERRGEKRVKNGQIHLYPQSSVIRNQKHPTLVPTPYSVLFTLDIDSSPWAKKKGGESG